MGPVVSLCLFGAETWKRLDGGGGGQLHGVGVDFGGEAHVAVTHQLHCDPRGNVAFQQVGSKSLTKCMEVSKPPGSINVSNARPFQITLKPLDPGNPFENKVFVLVAIP